VVFTDAKQDVLRRDFTINGLLYDPVTGEVIDYVNGRADIDAKIVRAIGDPHSTLRRDKLRILRAVRFGARLGYTIEPNTWTPFAPWLQRFIRSAANVFEMSDSHLD
jgi:poly(A) polymerase